MAMDRKLLAAYRDGPMDDDDELDELEVEIEDDEVEVEGGESEEDTAALEAFLQMLMQHGAEIESAAHAVDLFEGDAELDDETTEQLQAALETLPEELRAGIKTHLADMSMDDLHELLEALEEGGAFENDALVVPWLYYAARVA